MILIHSPETFDLQMHYNDWVIGELILLFIIYQALEVEKKKVVSEFSQRESEALKLSQEKETLSATTQTLQHSLKEIENKTQKLLAEKREFEERLDVK